MIAPASKPPSRESFFALYWDHARDLPRLSLCILAKFNSSDIPMIVSRDWWALLTYERAQLRGAFVALLAQHDEIRVEMERSRGLRGEQVLA